MKVLWAASIYVLAHLISAVCDYYWIFLWCPSEIRCSWLSSTSFGASCALHLMLMVVLISLFLLYPVNAPLQLLLLGVPSERWSVGCQVVFGQLTKIHPLWGQVGRWHQYEGAWLMRMRLVFVKHFDSDVNVAYVTFLSLLNLMFEMQQSAGK